MMVKPWAVAILLGACAAVVHAQAGRVPIVIETALGTIEAELDSVHAPGTVTNFLKYVDAHDYDGGRFHRTVRMDNQPTNTVKIEVIQGGVAPDTTRPHWPAIALERTNVTGLKHVDGTLSMARGGPDSATSDFFICIGAQPELDFAGKRNADGQGFAAFGRVTKGMDIVRRIQTQNAEAQKLVPPVTIVRINRKK
jgi:peptidyl-prolyl cis-trans isomerase A (cyclophilin A)